MRLPLRVAALGAVAVLLSCGNGTIVRPAQTTSSSQETAAISSPPSPATAVNAPTDSRHRPQSRFRPQPLYLRIPGYDVGVDYHAYGGDFMTTTFITQYHLPGVRDMVRAQLQGMADHGATVISTRIWFVTEPGTTDFGQKWRATFPMTDQEQANLRAYAQDVAAVQGVYGNRLRLDLCTLWLGAADYNRGTPDTGLGFTPLTAAEFTRRVELTTDKLLAAVSDIVRPDGVRLVDTIYLEGELMIGAKANQDWFIATHYPRFVSRVQAAGFKPAVYFIVSGPTYELLQTPYFDVDYPILNDHRSMYWMYRSLKFMVDRGMYIPSRIDFSFYVSDAPPAPYAALLARALADADAVLPSLGAPRFYGAAETFYFTDANERRLLGQAFASEALNNPRLQRVCFWTTPTSGSDGVPYPFVIEDYYPPLK